MNKCLIIVGPTAVGKTRLSINLALRLNSEIISADSMQIYKSMDIGTAKASKEEQKLVNHYMIDIVDPSDSYSVADFKRDSLAIIKDLQAKNKLPIVVGGSGLYINSLTHNLDFSAEKSDDALRKRLQKELEERGNESLYEDLKKIDPKSAEKIHHNNTNRLIRALEVNLLSDKKFSESNNDFDEYNRDFDFFIIGLTDDRSSLYDRINKRVDLMLEDGLLAECKILLENLDRDCQAMKAIGYKEVISYLNREISYDDMIDLLKKNSRHFAKRQLTWFKRDDRINWLDLSSYDKFEDLEDEVYKKVRKWLDE